VKCESYLPIEIGCTKEFGEFRVQVVRCESRDGFSVREVLLQVDNFTFNENLCWPSNSDYSSYRFWEM